MAKLQSIESGRITIIGNPKVHKRKIFIPINGLKRMSSKKLEFDSVITRFNSYEIKNINELLEEFKPQSYDPEHYYLDTIEEIKVDINSGVSKYKILEKWLESNSGLAKYEPNLIRNIAMECGLSN